MILSFKSMWQHLKKYSPTNKQKKLFRTEEDIVANIQTQFGMPHTGKDLLLDAKMGLNKDKSSRLDLEPDALSDTGMSDDVGAGDTSGILHDSAGGNKNTITGTNTPRASRASAYYDLLRSQHKDGHYKAPAYRVVDAIESPLQAGASALNYHDEDAVSDDYEVTFSNATAIPWCPGELNDGQYGHYDLDCTIYLTGYDRYTDPETQAPNGADGGTGNLEALAESCDAGTLTRTIIKQDQYGNEYAGNAVSSRYTKTITLPNGASGFQGWYKDGEDTYGNVEWASILYRMDWEELYGIVDGIKCRATGSGMTEEELRQLFTSLNIDATTARGQVVAFALSCQGKFVYAQPSSLRGGPGNPSVGINLDCSSFVQYCYWAQNLPFSAGSTAAYRNAADLVSISPSEVQPGDLRVVYASGGEQGHVQMALGGGAWIECCYGYGVAVKLSTRCRWVTFCMWAMPHSANSAVTAFAPSVSLRKQTLKSSRAGLV